MERFSADSEIRAPGTDQQVRVKTDQQVRVKFREALGMKTTGRIMVISSVIGGTILVGNAINSLPVMVALPIWKTYPKYIPIHPLLAALLFAVAGEKHLFGGLWMGLSYTCLSLSCFLLTMKLLAWAFKKHGAVIASLERHEDNTRARYPLVVAWGALAAGWILTA